MAGSFSKEVSLRISACYAVETIDPTKVAESANTAPKVDYFIPYFLNPQWSHRRLARLGGWWIRVSTKHGKGRRSAGRPQESNGRLLLSCF